MKTAPNGYPASAWAQRAWRQATRPAAGRKPGEQPSILQRAAIGADRDSLLAYVALGGAGLLLRWLCASHASILPPWAPWDFSWVEFLGTWLTIWWFVRGLALTPAPDRPSLAGLISFLAGTLAIYSVLETRFEYLAQHMFVLNRVQHVVMHHLGPMLIALSWPGATIIQGMPAALRPLVRHRYVAAAVSLVQQPVLAALLFVGLIFFWLIPPVHFRAMIDPRLYAIMNWSMVIDGILFWCLVLDPRPSPPARTSFVMRAAIVIAVMFPQILGGALVAFSRHDLYPSYDLCGRVFPGVDALADQTLGGLVIWIPPAMMSVLGLLLVLNAWRRIEEATPGHGQEHSAGRSASVAILACRWTGH